MKVAHFIDSGGFYGAERMLIELILASKTDIEHTVYSIGEPNQTEKPLEKELKRHNIALKVVRMPKFSLGRARQLLLDVEKDGTQIAHSHGYKFNICFGLLKHKLNSMKCVATIHGYVPVRLPQKLWFYHLVETALFQKLDKLFLVSPHMQFFPKFRHLKRDKVTTIVNGIRASKNSVVSRCQNGCISLLFVGRLSPEKGVADLIDIVNRVNKDGKSVSLTVIGDGPLKSLLMKKVSQLEMTNVVSFLGYVDAPSARMREFSALVINSITEGVPITLLEAMSEGLPIISTNVGGIHHVLGDEYPYICSVDSKMNLEEKIRAFLKTDDETKKRLGEYVYHRFNTYFTACIMAQRYTFEYKKVLKG